MSWQFGFDAVGVACLSGLLSHFHGRDLITKHKCIYCYGVEADAKAIC